MAAISIGTDVLKLFSSRKEKLNTATDEITIPVPHPAVRRRQITELLAYGNIVYPENDHDLEYGEALCLVGYAQRVGGRAQTGSAYEPTIDGVQWALDKLADRDNNVRVVA